MTQHLRYTICLFAITLLIRNCIIAQSFTIAPPNPIFRISTPTAFGNSKTGNIVVSFSLTNYSISKAQFQLFPYEIKAIDELNVQHIPISIVLGRKTYRKQEVIAIDLAPGDSTSFQMLFSKFNKETRYIPQVTAKNRVIMQPLFDQVSILNVQGLVVYWQK